MSATVAKAPPAALSCAMIPSQMLGQGSFVGRARELGELMKAVADADAGAGSLWLVAGEPGIGKSRLVEEVARSASESHAIAWGRCSEAGGAPVFWPWIQVLRALLRKRDSGIDWKALGAHANWLAEIVPELEGHVDQLSKPPSIEANEARFRLFDAVATALSVAAQSEPLLIVLEDVHMADAGSVQLLEFVAGQLKTAPLVVLATLRTAEARSSGSYPVLARIARSGRTITLGRLTLEAVSELVAASLGQAPQPTIVDEVYQRTEGHPLFLREVVLRMAHEQSSGSVPTTLGEAIAEHVAALTESTRGVLQRASAVGREVDVRLLAELSDCDVGALTAPLAEAVDRGVLIEVETGLYRFSHILVREAHHRALTPSERPAIHRRIAEMLTTKSPRPWAQIAHHLLEAGPDSRPAAVDALAEAAAEATKRLAFDEAVELYAQALSVLESGATDPRRRCELLLGLACARVDAGDPRSARQACLLALDQARQLDSPELFARAVLARGSVFVYGDVDDKLVALLEEASQSVPDGALRALVMARLAAALQPAPDPAGPIAMAREAIELARSLGDDEVLLEALHNGVSAMMDLLEPQQRVPFNREHVELAQRLQKPLEELRGHMRLVFDGYEMGDVALGSEALDAAERIVDTLDHPAHRWKIFAMRAMQALHEGRLDDAERHGADARAWSDGLGDPNAARSLLFQSFVTAMITRSWDRALAQLPELELAFADMPFSKFFMRVMRSLVLGMLGRGAEVDTAIAGNMVDVAIRLRDTSVLDMFAQAALALKDRELARKLDDVLGEMGSRFASFGMIGMVVSGPMSGLHARLVAMLGDHTRAGSLFEDAIGRARAARAPLHLGWLSAQYAEHLIGCGVSDERVEALLSEAAELAANMKVTALGELVSRLRGDQSETAAGPTAASASPAVPSVGSFQLREEGGVWIVQCDGQSFHLKHLKGLQLLSRLVGEPGREIHVLELDGSAPAAVHSDAGEAIDKDARDAYRARVRDLREELEEAEEWNDAGRSERIREELRALEAELARSIGLGGRARRSASAAERARINTQRRLKAAIRRIADQHEALGRHLDYAVRTGTFCSYQP